MYKTSIYFKKSVVISYFKVLFDMPLTEVRQVTFDFVSVNDIRNESSRKANLRHIESETILPFLKLTGHQTFKITH